ncbi:hydantoinase/oxoprolinase family protein [Gelria sp. Kuro-4]|uniref:hydantoinase/oxoprolinase family protein n=1 Tax=Gelria sp. Kuro-4 TaxID=2796927 RepID=UPI001BEDC040|nr:hydantoinase/oxoprolinase family protein [Gelria sp. Kuro-4]BCV26054.1 5-oxoprolinase [Gelria sp. Kuro-4]
MIRIAVDTGGTHTDVVLFNEKNGNLVVTKVPTTSEDLGLGVVSGCKKAFNEAHCPAESVAYFMYGTTFLTNMIVQGEAENVALITTKGFRDILEIGKAARKGNIYDIYLDKPRPLVPRHLRFGVSERINAKGEVVQALDEDELEKIFEELCKKGVESIAVCLLHSYINDTHETRIAEVAKEKFPELMVSLSSDIAREFREYGRTSTTVINAYAKPAVTRHLEKLSQQLRQAGVDAETLVMQSNGGLSTFGAAKNKPVNIAHCGVVAGVIGGNLFARLAGFSNVITLDMGGTSCDVAIIEDNKPKTTTWSEVQQYPVITPTIEFQTIGAGGGSIAWIDTGGALRVGPKSAQANPGPACYGKGGLEPTVTDANLVLGRINPGFFLGGEMHLHPEKAIEAIKQKVANPLGMDVVQAAKGIIDIVNSNMIRALKVVSTSKGYDPRDFALVAFGGAGPMHAGALADELEIGSVVIPYSPGAVAALGLLNSDIRYDYVHTLLSDSADVDLDAVNQSFREMETMGYQQLQRDGIPDSAIAFVRSIDMRYRGQAYEISVPVEVRASLSREDLDLVCRGFNELHTRVYGYCTPGKPVEIVNLRVTAIGGIPKPPLKEEECVDTSPDKAFAGTREVFFTDRYVNTPVYRTKLLRAGNVIKGPAILEEYGSTVVVFPGHTATMDQYRNIIIHTSFCSKRRENQW